MSPTKKLVPIVLSGLLALGAACSSSSKDSARDGGVDGLIVGGSGGYTAVGGSAGGSPGGGVGSSAGLASGGAGVNGGSSTGSGGTGTAGNTGNGGQRTAGNTGTGGASASTGGNAGNGGRSTAGNTAGSTTSAGAGGTSTAGTTSGGGSQAGGSGGNPKIDAAADVGSSPDAMVDSGRPDSPADRPQTTDTGSTMTLDACFADLPKAVGAQMVATKQSSDNRVRIRIALDTEDRMGTSGSYGWGLIRLAVEVDGEVTCIKDRASLKYTGSHHNCSDKATATSGSTTYSLGAPDRSSTSITIAGSGAANGTWTVTDTTCSMAGSFTAECRSGGPC
jgi:hypothetical protein